MEGSCTTIMWFENVPLNNLAKNLARLFEARAIELTA